MILHDICQAKHRLIGEGGSLLKSGGAVKAKKRRQKMRAAASIYCESNDRLLSSVMILVQHRVAWLEQIVLRILGIPHMVVNSAYSVAEATGPLPFVISTDPDTCLPCLVGRRNPSVAPSSAALVPRDHKGDYSADGQACHPYASDIIQFLRNVHRIDLDSTWNEEQSCYLPTLTSEQRADSISYSCLIQYKLDPILHALRYCDKESYREVACSAAKRGALDPDSSCLSNNPSRRYRLVPPFFGLFNFFPWFQNYCDKTAAISRLSHIRLDGGDLIRRKRGAMGYEVILSVALANADICYRALDDRLRTIATGADDADAVFLLATQTPSNADAILFAHVAEALCDRHLVTVLSQYGYLTKYFCTLYDRYFGSSFQFARCEESLLDEEVVRVSEHELNGIAASNNLVNIRNAYSRNMVETAGALTNMTMPLSRHTIVSSLEEPPLICSALHRLRLGGGLFDDSRNKWCFARRHHLGNCGAHNSSSNNADSSSSSSLSEQVKKMKLDSQRNDKIWLVTMLGGILLTFAASRKAS